MYMRLATGQVFLKMMGVGFGPANEEEPVERLGVKGEGEGGDEGALLGYGVHQFRSHRAPRLLPGGWGQHPVGEGHH